MTSIFLGGGGGGGASRKIPTHSKAIQAYLDHLKIAIPIEPGYDEPLYTSVGTSIP